MEEGQPMKTASGIYSEPFDSISGLSHESDKPLQPTVLFTVAEVATSYSKPNL